MTTKSICAQGVIVCTNGDVIKAVEIERGSKGIYYKDSLSIDAPIKRIDENKVSVIQYPDGKRLVIDTPPQKQKVGTLKLNKQKLPKEEKGWNCFFVQYNAITILSNEKELDNISANGFSIGYSRIFGLLSEMKIYTELGIAYQNASAQENTQIAGRNMHETLEWKSLKMFSNIFINNKIQNSSIRICPYIGFQLRRNLSVDYEQSYKGEIIQVNGLKNGKWKKNYVDIHFGVHAIMGRHFQLSTQYGFDLDSKSVYGKTRGWTLQASVLL